MSLDTKTAKAVPSESVASRDFQWEFFFILKDVFENIYPAILFLGGIAIAASFLQTFLGKATYGFFFIHLLLFLGFIAIVFVRRRIAPQLGFPLILSIVYAFSVISLFNRGLAGSGMIHMIFFCVLAGSYFSFRRAMTVLSACILTVSLMAIGFCSGIFPSKSDSADYLLQPVNWLMQVSCIIMYSVTLILSMKGYMQKIVDSQKVLEETNLKLEAEIASRRTTEEKLRQSEEKYRNIFDHAVEGLFQVSPKGRLISANPSLARMMGYSSQEEIIAEVTNVRAQGCIDDADRETVVKCLKTEGGVVGEEIRIYRKDGSLAWVSVNCGAVRGEDGKILWYEGSIEDITKRRETEQALIESEANYRSIVEGSVAGFFTIQHDVYKFVNSRACEMTGYSSDDIVDVMKSAEPIHPDDRQLVQAHLERCLAGDMESIPFDARLICRNGKLITARFLVGRTLLKNEPAVSGTFIDMSRERSLEGELRQAQKMQAVGQLAGGVAHDFNNILTLLGGYGRLLQMTTPKDDVRRGYADQIISASQKAESLTQNLLAFSRQQPITLVSVEINSHIRETEKLLRRLLTEDIVFTIALSDEPITTMADAIQIDRTLFNLVANARDAMPQGGRLTLKTGVAVLDDDFRKFHGFGKPGRYAFISLSDTGIGMDKTTMEQIFDPFFTTKEPGQGTGLGLATVYGIVKQHGGYIAVDSHPGQGATFDIYFPVTRNVRTDKESNLPETFPGGKETILIADDNDAVREFIKEVLELSGYRTIEATDGDDAVKKYGEVVPIDLVILDTVMPKMNGREAFEEMRKTNPSVQSLFISGYSNDILLNKGVRDKEFHFLSKPLFPEALLKKVRDIIDGETADRL